MKTWALRRSHGRPRTSDDDDTDAAAPLGVDWIRPYWLERQLDPRSPAFVPRGRLAVLANVTHRNWTAVGTVASGTKGIVDPRGLLTPRLDGWSLDWWIGAEDRWHFPSREAAVRQQLVGDTPVVETTMRIPGGDAVQRVYAVPDGLAVMEITNDTPTPIAVGLAIRPYNPEGLAVVERVRLHDRTVTVDDRPALLLAKRPQRMAASTFLDGDVAHKVTTEDLATELADDLRCEAGRATATFVFPLAHRQTLRVAVPMEAGGRSARVRPGRRRVGRTPRMPDVLPDSDAVVRSWQAQTSNRGMRVVLPEGRLASAVEANRRHLLLFHEGADVVSGPFTYHDFRFGDAAFLLSALDRCGFHQESAEVLAFFPGRQRVDGSFFSGRREGIANGAALAAMAEHWRLSGSLDHLDVAAVAKGAGWIERKRAPSADRLGSRSLSADLWSLRGLLDGAALLRAVGADPLADECDRWAEAMRIDLEASMARVAERLDADGLSSGLHPRIDPAVVGALVACSPLRLFAADHPGMTATAQVIRERFCIGPACYEGIGDTGLSTSLTLQLASVELEAGDRTALDRLGWLLDVASPTFTWPEAIHPGLGAGCMGDGHDGRAAAGLVSFVRQLLVRETFDGTGLALCTMLPDAWVGQPIEVHDAPTHFGPLSFAVRYHGERPALLWDLEVRAGVGPVRLTAPGLDPTWSTTAAKGEALLSAAAGGPVPIGAEGSFT